MPRRSAGILPYRRNGGVIEVLLGHPGGPFWRARDLGAWSVFKGEYDESENAEAAALREFGEETGWSLDVALEPLGEVTQRGGKIVTAYAARADFDAATLVSNTFELEWPPRGGIMQSFPEIDRAQWFSLTEARARIIPGQVAFLDRLAAGPAGAPPQQPSGD